MGSKSFTNKVVGIFNNREVVDSVLTELNTNGFDRDDISVLARDFDENSDRIITHSPTTYPETDTIRDSSLTGNVYASNNINSDIYPGTMAGNLGTVNRNMGETYDSVSAGTNVNGPVLRESGAYDIVDDTPDYDEVHDVAEKDPKAMVKGATAGGALGLIAGIGLLMIPGVGPILAAGPIAAALTAAAGGAAIGATAGTLLGLLKDEGIPGDRADFYNRSFNKGDVLIMVHTDEGRMSLAREIFLKYNPATVDTF